MRPFVPLALLLALVSAQPARAQWEFTGPGIFTPNSVAQNDGSVFFAVTRGSGASVSGGIVYRSTDGIRDWEPVTGPLVTTSRPLGPYITTIGAGGGAVAIATREAYNVAYVYLSTDDGATWTERRTFPTVYEGQIRSLHVLNADTLVALANTGGGQARLFVSTDAGLTWTQRDRAFGSVAQPTLLDVDGRLVLPYSGSLGVTQVAVGVEVSDDLGVTWTPRYTALNAFGVSQIVLWADGERLLQYVTPSASNAAPRLQWTDDFGATFSMTESRPGGVAGTISAMASRGDRVVARGFLRQRQGSAEVVDDNVIGVSEDLGATWTEGDRDSTLLRGSELPGGVSSEPIGVTAVPGGFLASPVLHNTNATALYTSVDGLDWRPAPVNGFGQGLGSVFEHDGELYAFEIGAGSAGGYWRSEDGAAWRYVGHLNDPAATFFATCGESGYPGLAASADSVVVALCTNGDAVYHSHDGETFTEIGATPDTRLRMLTESDGRLFAAGFNSTLGATGGQNGTLYRSDDAGATWTTLASEIRTLTRPSISGDHILMAEAGKVYLSTDGGASFAQTLPLPGTFASAEVGAAATPTALFAGAAQTNSFFNTPLFYRSVDGGAAWEDMIAAGLVADGPRALHALDDGSLVAVFTDSVAVTSDAGQTWKSLADAWPRAMRSDDAFVFHDTLYVQLSSGSLWRAALADFTGPDGGTASAAGPDGGLELAAWPNPASGAATVRLRLDAPGSATLTVSDVLGRTVATLADGALRAGEQTLPLDTSALAPGVYVLRLVLADGRGLTRPITVAR